MWPNPQFSGDLVTFTEKILNGKLHFLCSHRDYYQSSKIMIEYVHLDENVPDVFTKPHRKPLSQKFKKYLFSLRSNIKRGITSCEGVDIWVIS